MRKLSTVYETWKFVTAFRRVHHSSHMNLLHSLIFYFVLKLILILLYHLHSSFPIGLFHSTLSVQSFTCNTHVHVTSPHHHILFNLAIMTVCGEEYEAHYCEMYSPLLLFCHPWSRYSYEVDFFQKIIMNERLKHLISAENLF